MTEKQNKRAFNGVKVFCTTVYAWGQVLGETVTAWLDGASVRPGFQLVDLVVQQSSDDAFHCLSICLFYNEDLEQADAECKHLEALRKALEEVRIDE